MHKKKLIFKRPQVNLFRNTLFIYITLVILICIFNSHDLPTLKGSVYVLSGITLPVLLVELLAARTFWKKFTFDSISRILLIEKYFLFFKNGVVNKIKFESINVFVGLENRRCGEGDGTFWCVYVNNSILTRPLEKLLPEKFVEEKYPVENRLLKICAEKTKNKILEFIKSSGTKNQPPY